MPDPRRVLIIRPSALGDVCRTVPVLASLRAAWPEAEIDWIVQDSFMPAIAAHPALNEAIPFPRARWRRWWRSPAISREVLRWLGDLRRRRYDLAIDCQGLGRSGLMTAATRAPRRIGPRSAREAAWVAYTERVDDQADHTVDRMLSLVEAAGIEAVRDMRLYAADADVAWWCEERSRLGATDYAVLAPTSRWASKQWPIEYWKTLIKPIQAVGMRSIVVIGAPGEQPQVEAFVRGREDLTDLVGALSIGQTMAVVRDAGLVIANDSAPLHMAVGFDRPCVALFGPTDPARVGPYDRAEAVIRAYDGEIDPSAYKDAQIGDRMMRLIEPRSVIERIERVLGMSSSSSG